MTPFDLSGRTAVVTGAFGKLGSVWTSSLLAAGANVVAIDLPGATPSKEFQYVAETTGDRLIVALADVRDRASLVAVLESCRSRDAIPDILVNNAGIDQPPVVTEIARLEDIPVEAVEGVLAVNVVGAFVTSQVFGAEMVRAGRGSIINIGSLYGSVSPDARFYDHLSADPPFLKPPAYGASKAALVNLTRYFATHWGPSGVRVNALSPGGVAGGQDPQFVRKFTNRVPLSRMATSKDLVGPLLFLASDASSYVTGIELLVDGGFTAW